MSPCAHRVPLQLRSPRSRRRALLDLARHERGTRRTPAPAPAARRRSISVASAFSAGVGAAARLRVDPHRHRRGVGAARQVLRDDEVVDRQRERHQQARRHRRQRAAAAARGARRRAAARRGRRRPPRRRRRSSRSRARTISTTHDSVNVTWPIACAVGAQPDEAERRREEQEQADREHELGRDQRQQQQDVRRRPRPARASAACRARAPCPAGPRRPSRSPPAARLCASASSSVGSWNTLRFGSPQNQRNDQPCADVRERPSLNAKRIGQQHRRERPDDVEAGDERAASAAGPTGS